MKRLRVSCVMKRGVWMAISRLVLVSVFVSCVLSFGMRRGERRRFFTCSASASGVASIGADCWLTPSENGKRSPSEVGVGSRCDMGWMPGVFALVTLSCVQGTSLMAAVADGLVELCCGLGYCVFVFVLVC